MKNIAFLLIIFISGFDAFGQSSLVLPNAIQLPQVNGTSSIDSAKNGMIVFNNPDQSLYYRKDNEWVKIKNIANNEVAAAPTIYYTVTASPAIPGEITTGHHEGQTKIEFVDYNLAKEVGLNGGVTIPSVSAIKIAKQRGTNSIPFLRNLIQGTSLTTMEIFFYDETDHVYFSIKLSSVFITKIDKSELGGLETITLVCKKIGWKDYTTSPATTGTFETATNSFSTSY